MDAQKYSGLDNRPSRPCLAGKGEANIPPQASVFCSLGPALYQGVYAMLGRSSVDHGAYPLKARLAAHKALLILLVYHEGWEKYTYILHSLAGVWRETMVKYREIGGFQGWCLFPFCFFLGTLVVFVFWFCLRRVTFQRWKVTKDRRACGPGPCVGAKSAPFRFRLKPKTALRSFAPPSPHRTRFAGLRRGPHEGGRRWRYGACKSFGCYPPF